MKSSSPALMSLLPIPEEKKLTLSSLPSSPRTDRISIEILGQVADHIQQRNHDTSGRKLSCHSHHLYLLEDVLTSFSHQFLHCLDHH
jgi:hypothetical protein